MHLLRSLLSSSGIMAPRPFLLAALGVYAAGVASQLLTAPAILVRLGLLPFLLVQGGLIWIWYAVHARRLRDAGAPTASAAAVAALYGLSVALLIALVYAFDLSPERAAEAPFMVGGFVDVYLVGAFSSAPDLSANAFVLTGIALIACVPSLLAVAFSAWAGTRARLPAQA